MTLIVGCAAFSAPRAARAEISLTPPSAAAAIQISAEWGCHWTEGSVEVWLLSGNSRLTQGTTVVQGGEGVVWIHRAEPTEPELNRVEVYFEGDVSVEDTAHRSRLTDRTWFGSFQSARTVQIAARRETARPGTPPPLWQRAKAHLAAAEQSSVQPVQYVAPGSNPFAAPAPAVDPATGAPIVAPGRVAPPSVPPMGPATATSPAPSPASPGAFPFMGTPDAPAPPLAAVRIRAFPRSNVAVQAQWYPDPNSQQQIGLITSGVNLVIDGLPNYNVPGRGVFEIGTLDISADRVVIWTISPDTPDLKGERPQDARWPLELYLEGNVEFRQGDRVIRADRMYYDVMNRVGTVLNAEVLTPVPEYAGLLRLHTAVLQQTGEGHFIAQDAFLTSSRMGQPGYRLQAGDIEFEDVQVPAVDPASGQPVVNPETGQAVVEHQRMATSRNNLIYVGPAPIFYWPVFATDMERPTFYLRRPQIKNDRVYGFQVLTDWDGYQLLGLRNPPQGTDLQISLDWLSKRGFGYGGMFTYNRDGFLGVPGPAQGLWDFWGIQDNGLDNLGRDRAALQPEVDYRFRLLGQHRQMLPYDIQFTGEVGWISDRNFLQSYFERDWNEFKDADTGIELKRTRENRSLSLTADARVNDFFTQTEWLPRLDHFWIGQPLLDNRLTWYEHSSAAYARFEKLAPPSNPADQPFTFMPWEANSRDGERFTTRQEIDWPFLLGPVKVVPYALGELAHWGEDIDGNDLQRAYGQAGVRGSLPFWRADPSIENSLWNVHGVAHKAELLADVYVADATQDVDELPLYDPIDDDSIEAFRRRLATLTFGAPSPIPPIVGNVPQPFDPRYYAVRTGLASWVTSPSTEIADDLLVARLGLHQRWQTKRGLPGNRKIIDWIVFNTDISYFPKPSADNYGEPLGLWDYDFRWYVGDRLTLVSEGLFDFFTEGQQIMSVGGYLSRPPRGSLYLGFRYLEGPIRSEVITASYSYWMSPKWISALGMTIDLADENNLSENFTITRVGESFLISAGLNFDSARDNVGIAFAIEPRFLPKSRLGRVGGAQIPPAGAYGLE